MPGKPPLPEQRATHIYRPIPRRASADVVTEDWQPGASPHRAGHHAGLHPEDRPYLTPRNIVMPARQMPQTNAPGGDEDDSLSPGRPPSSARRYRPQDQGSQRGNRAGFYILLVGSSILVGGMIASMVPPLLQRGSDQLHYGYPRTYQTDINVGHYEAARDKRSHFIALNNHGYIEVLEVPEGVPGEANEMHLYFIASPGSSTADQAPVTLDFEDVNGDGKLDMEVSCNNIRTIFYNDGHAFQGKL